MNTSNNFKSYLAVALVVAVSAVTGCASTQTPSSNLRVERHSGGGVQVQSVYLAQTDKGLRISGSVGRMVGYNNSPRRHLDVEIIAADGAVLSRVAANFNPNPIRRSRHSRTHSNYTVTLPKIPPAGSVVRVAVHADSLSHCRN